MFKKRGNKAGAKPKAAGLTRGVSSESDGDMAAAAAPKTTRPTALKFKTQDAGKNKSSSKNMPAVPPPPRNSAPAGAINGGASATSTSVTRSGRLGGLERKVKPEEIAGAKTADMQMDFNFDQRDFVPRGGDVQGNADSGTIKEGNLFLHCDDDDDLAGAAKYWSEQRVGAGVDGAGVAVASKLDGDAKMSQASSQRASSPSSSGKKHKKRKNFDTDRAKQRPGAPGVADKKQSRKKRNRKKETSSSSSSSSSSDDNSSDAQPTIVTATGERAVLLPPDPGRADAGDVDQHMASQVERARAARRAAQLNSQLSSGAERLAGVVSGAGRYTAGTMGGSGLVADANYDRFEDPMYGAIPEHSKLFQQNRRAEEELDRFGLQRVGGVGTSNQRNPMQGPAPGGGFDLPELQSAKAGRARIQQLLHERKLLAVKETEKTQKLQAERGKTVSELRHLEQQLRVKIANVVVLREFDGFARELSLKIDGKKRGVSDAEKMLGLMEEAYCHGSFEPVEGFVEEDAADGAKRLRPLVATSYADATIFTDRREEGKAQLNGTSGDSAITSDVDPEEVQLREEFFADRRKFRRACERQFGEDRELASASEVFQQFHLLRAANPQMYKTYVEAHLAEALALSVRAEMLLDWDPLGLVETSSPAESATVTSTSANGSFVPVQRLPFFAAFSSFAADLDDLVAGKILEQIFEKAVWPKFEHYLLHCLNPYGLFHAFRKAQPLLRPSGAPTTAAAGASAHDGGAARVATGLSNLVESLFLFFDATMDPTRRQNLWAERFEKILAVRFLNHCEVLAGSDLVLRKQREHWARARSRPPREDAAVHPLAATLLHVLFFLSRWYACFKIGEDSYRGVDLVVRLFASHTTDLSAVEKLAVARDVVVQFRKNAGKSGEADVFQLAFLEKFGNAVQPLLNAVPTSAEMMDLRVALLDGLA
eukprot:g11693.t1